jgi:hypothetical protein
LGTTVGFFEEGAPGDVDGQVAGADFFGLVGVFVVEVAAADNEFGAGFDAHDFGDVGGGGGAAGEDDVVAQVVGEQLPMVAGAAVAAAGAALEPALFLDEGADAVAGLDESFGAGRRPLWQQFDESGAGEVMRNSM